MNLTEHEIRKKYRYSNLSYVFDVYMECEYRANLTKEEYDGLLPGEFRFDYNSWGGRLGFTKKQMERAIKELTIKSAVIKQTVKGNKGTSSKYFLMRFNDIFKENNKENKEECNKRTISLDSTVIDEYIGEQKEQYKEKKKARSSQYNNLNIISNNIYSDLDNKDYINEELEEDLFNRIKSSYDPGVIKKELDSLKDKGCKYYVSIPSEEIQPSREIQPTPSRETQPQKENKKKIWTFTNRTNTVMHFQSCLFLFSAECRRHVATC